MTMAKVVQFLEIGNLPKSQLNPCRSRKDQRAISAEKCMGSYVPIKKFPHMGEGPYIEICPSCFLHFFDIIFPHLFRFCSISMIEWLTLNNIEKKMQKTRPADCNIGTLSHMGNFF